MQALRQTPPRRRSIPWARPFSLSGCKKCGSQTAATLAAVGVLALAIFALWGFIYINRRAPNGLLRPFINLVQNLTVILLFDAPFPESLLEVSQIFASISLGVEVVSPRCSGVANNYYTQLAMMVAGLVVVCLVLLASTMRNVFRELHRSTAVADRCLSRAFAKRFVSGMGRRLARTPAGRLVARDIFVVVLLLHPSLSGKAMQFFRCQAIDGVSFLRADLSIECYDVTWFAYFPFVILILLAFSFGTPIAVARELYRHRTELYDEGGLVKPQPLDVLYAIYRPEAYLFESVQMTFKLALWSTLVFFESGSELQLATALVVNIIQLCVHMNYLPMGGPDATLLNNLQTGTLVITTYINFGGNALNHLLVSRNFARCRDPDSCSLESCPEFDRPAKIIGVIMQLLTFALIATFMVVAVKKAYQNARDIYAKAKDLNVDASKIQAAVVNNPMVMRLKCAFSSSDSADESAGRIESKTLSESRTSPLGHRLKGLLASPCRSKAATPSSLELRVLSTTEMHTNPILTSNYVASSATEPGPTPLTCSLDEMATPPALPPNKPNVRNFVSK